MAIVISGVNNNDKITASDGTIDLLSGVNYVGVITAPAIQSSGNITASGNVSGVNITSSNNLTAANINVGSNIHFGNAGIITATTLLGNVTGNINHTSNLLLQINGSEKFRVGNGGQFGIAGANYGTAGQVFTSGGSGSAPTWSTISGTTISGNANNRVITGSASANTLNGESTLTYDGDGLLSMTSSSGPAEITLVAPSANDSGIYFNDGSNDGAISYDHSTRNMNFRANSQTKFRIEGDTKTLKIQRPDSSAVDIVLAKAQRWGYSNSWQGLIIGNPAVGNMSSLFLNYDPSSNTSGSFGGDGREIVVRKNAKIIVPNNADNAFYNAIEFNCGGSRDDGVSRFRQGIIVSNDAADANVLDDYEEGSYTADFEVTSGSANFHNNTLHYVKIGSMCYVHGEIGTNSASSAGGDLRFDLPFTAKASGSNMDGHARGICGAIWNYYGSSNPHGSYGWYPLHIQLNSGNANNIILYIVGYNGTNSNWGPIGNLIGSGAQIGISFTYRTA